MTAATAVHIGVGQPADSRCAGWARLLSCDDAARRLTELCTAVGVSTQHRLLDAQANMSRVRSTIATAAAATGPYGALILTFSGHGERPIPGEHHGGWYLHDGVLRHAETVELLSTVHHSAQIIVVADTCHAAAFADLCADVPATTVLLAACAANQTTLNHPVSEFVAALIRLTLPGGSGESGCRSYAELQRQLRAITPDVERPEVRANRPHALRQRPFHIRPGHRS